MAEYAEYWLLLAGAIARPQEREEPPLTESELSAWSRLGEAERIAAEVRAYGRSFPPVCSASSDGTRPAVRDKKRMEKA
jgi:hypothetical protein